MIVAPCRVRFPHDHLASDNEGLLVCKYDVLTRFYGGKGGEQTGGPNDCNDGSVGLVKSSQGFDAFLSKKKLRLIGKGNAGVGGVLEASVGN